MPRISGELVMTQAPKCALFQLKNTASLSSAGESTPVGHGGHFRTGGLSHWPGAGSDLQKVRLSQPPPPVRLGGGSCRSDEGADGTDPGCEGHGCGLVVQPGAGAGAGPSPNGGTSTRPTSRLSGVAQHPGLLSGLAGSWYGRVLLRFLTQEPAVWQGWGSLWQGSGSAPLELSCAQIPAQHRVVISNALKDATASGSVAASRCRH